MGFALIIFIIGLIVTVVVLLLPEDPKENQEINNTIKNRLSHSDNEKLIIDSYDRANTLYTVLLLQCRTAYSFNDFNEYALEIKNNGTYGIRSKNHIRINNSRLS